jgi:hypothetical protein
MTWDVAKWWLEEAAKLTPIVTALIALAAFSLAWRTLRVNRRIARERAAIDFATKMISDKAVLELRRDLGETVAKFMKAGPSQAQDVRADFHNILCAINLFETMATGVNTGALDEDVCYRALATELFDMIKGTEAFRARLEGHPSAEQAGVEMEQLYARWRKRRDREMKTARRSADARSPSLTAH